MNEKLLKNKKFEDKAPNFIRNTIDKMRNRKKNINKETDIFDIIDIFEIMDL
ncbi:MAG TPA: hypothetical protein QF753_07920 [Victivallales bacterium]|nr:hypothetical protein [Victivallales bacterium]